MTPTRRLLLLIGLTSLLAMAGGARAQISIVVGGGGARVEGSGNVIEETRSVGPFSGLIVTGPVDVRLKAASADRVILHGDDNILPLIETRIEDGKLVVGAVSNASFRTRNDLYATVEFREMSSVLIRGSGDVRADRIKSPIFETTIRGSGDVVIDSLDSGAVALSISGSGDFTASGRADKLGVVIIGSGDVRVDKLEAMEAAVRIRGSGDVRVHAVSSLQVDIAGSGDVRYRGEPKITKKVAGSGEVQRLR